MDSFLPVDDLLHFGADCASPRDPSPSVCADSRGEDRLERCFSPRDAVGVGSARFSAAQSMLAVSFASPAVYLLGGSGLGSEAWGAAPWRRLEGHSAAVTCFAVDAECRLVSGGRDHRLLRHELAACFCAAAAELRGAAHAVCCLGEWTFVGTSDYAVLAATPRGETRLTGHCGQVTALSLARADGLLVSGGLDVPLPRGSEL